jgi:hypothetical protein
MKEIITKEVIHMEYDLEKLVLDILSKHKQLFQVGKERFTPDDISKLYGTSVATARQMMNRGDFGEVISITPRNKVVTLEGLLKYEALHTGFVSGKPEVKQRRQKTNRPAVGRI